jgi:MoaA/NifB/PqqE/SkfB family radical SAM enzyme
MITSKGEPTLFPEQISKYLRELQKFEFPFVELQTNGLALDDKYLDKWYKLGLTTVAVSIAHYDSEKNRQIYSPNKKSYTDLPKLVENLHSKGFSVRLACTMLKGFIDSPGELEKLVLFAKENEVEQLTVRPVNKPSQARDLKAYDWVDSHSLDSKQIGKIDNYLKRNGTLLLELPHGAQVYDVDGQNVCLTNCLTRDTDPEKIRQLIFFPDGHLRYDWEKKGAILL